jgi:hypothetical protein
MLTLARRLHIPSGHVLWFNSGIFLEENVRLVTYQFSSCSLGFSCRFFNNYQMYCFAVAAGFIAGEGLGGIVNAIFTISGVSGATYGTSVGCPGGVYCG